MEYMKIEEAAARWNLEERKVRILCQTGRIPGAKKEQGMWLLPSDSSKPSDSRYKERRQ